jgi:hypothetical protein
MYPVSSATFIGSLLYTFCLVSSIGWAAAYCAHHAEGPGFDPRDGRRTGWLSLPSLQGGAAGIQWVTAGEDCVVIWLESLPIGWSVWVAVITLCMPGCTLGPAHLRWLHVNALSNVLLLLLLSSSLLCYDCVLCTDTMYCGDSNYTAHKMLDAGPSVRNLRLMLRFALLNYDVQNANKFSYAPCCRAKFKNKFLNL